MEAMTIVRERRRTERAEKQRQGSRKTKMGREGKTQRRGRLVPGLQIKAGGEQQLQAGPPSTCCCTTAKWNTLFQQTHRLMASVGRPLARPWLPLQTLRGTGCTDTHRNTQRLPNTHCLHRVTHPWAHTHTHTQAQLSYVWSTRSFYCTSAWVWTNPDTCQNHKLT